MTDEPYDSTHDTLSHIRRVQWLLSRVSVNLTARGIEHDTSKLVSPEKEVFDRVTPRLKEITYGSDEYKAQLESEMKVALDHHYAANTHHPEHYKNGIRGMSMLDVIEMLCDWKAATERHADGDIMLSIQLNKDRFGYSDDRMHIFANTVDEMGWK